MLKRMKKLYPIALLLLLVLGFIVTRTQIGAFLLSSPWWVYLAIGGIVLSGILSLKYTIEDRRLEKEWIEQEGSVYLKRIEQEKERKITSSKVSS